MQFEKKHREYKFNKDVKTILFVHIFQLKLVNDVNRRGVKVIYKNIRILSAI